MQPLTPYTALANPPPPCLLLVLGQVKYFKGTFQDPNTFFQMPLASAVAREAARRALAAAPASAGLELAWEPSLVAFPHPKMEAVNLLAGVLAAFIFAALMFGFVSQVGSGNEDAGA